MSRHDSAQPPPDQLAVRQQVGHLDLDEPALVHRDIDVRVRSYVAVTWKMLADRRRPAGGQPGDECACERRDHRRVVRESAISDDAARAEVHVEHRGETEIDPVCPQLHRHDIARRFREDPRLSCAGIPALPEQAHRRDPGKALLKALHPPALMVHCDEQLGPAQSADLGRERAELARGLEVAREQDHAPHGRVSQDLLLLRRHPRPG